MIDIPLLVDHVTNDYGPSFANTLVDVIHHMTRNAGVVHIANDPHLDDLVRSWSVAAQLLALAVDLDTNTHDDMPAGWIDVLRFAADQFASHAAEVAARYTAGTTA